MYEITRSNLSPFTEVRISSRPWKVKYPFAKLGIGDSFFVPASDTPTATVRLAASNYARRWGIRLSCKLEGDGIRVTRAK